MKSSLLCIVAIQQAVASSTLTASEAADSPCIANVCLQKKVTSFKEDGAIAAKKELLWRPYIETGLLGERPGTNVDQTLGNSVYRRKRRVYLAETTAVEDLRPLQFTQTIARRGYQGKEPPPMAVEDCSSLDSLSQAKRDELAKGGVKFCVLAFGKALLGASKNIDTCKLRHAFEEAANLVAQLLDLDWDGVIDDAKVGDALDATRKTTIKDSPAAIFIVGCSKAEETPENDPKFNSDITGTPQSSQSYGSNSVRDIQGVLIEETFHYVHDGAWAWVYPDFVGYAGHANPWDPSLTKGKKDSSLVKCHRQAMCEFWLHPEQLRCSNAAGVACANPDRDYGSDETVASVAGYAASSLKPGACAKGGCSDSNCDLDEFFHKLYMAILGEDRVTGYSYVKASGGKEPKITWSNGNVEQFNVWAPAFLRNMQQSTECAAFLTELKNDCGVGKRYKLPTSKLTVSSDFPKFK